MKLIYNLRWWIVGLLLLINLDNNMDRQVYALAGPAIQQEFHWREVDYARMVAAFQFAFALTSLASGLFIDRVGARIGLGVSIFWFSVAQIAHALVRSTGSFGLVRVLLAIGEGPTYPATLKALAAWSPPQERAAAAGWVHFGVMLGPIVAPLAVPWLTIHFGWRSGFILSGVLGLLLISPWLFLYNRPQAHARLAPAELALIEVDRDDAGEVGGRIPWLGLLKHRQLWASVALQTLPNPAWWFLIYWLPKFLGSQFHLTGGAITPFLTFVYGLAALGAIIGGRFSGVLLRRGASLNVARKTTLGLCALAMPVVYLAVVTPSPWLAALVIGLAAAIHQTWTATSAAIVGDLFPSKVVASVVGISSFFGSLMGVLAAEITGRILDARPGFYLPMFAFAGGVYLVAALVVHLLIPRLERVVL